jgi:hypothetical protein
VGAETGVGTGAEGEVTVGMAVDHAVVRVLEDPLVPVGGAVAHRHHLPPVDGLAMQVEVAGGVAAEQLDGRENQRLTIAR